MKRIKIVDVFEVLSAVILFMVFAVVLFNVILRYIFNTGLAWSEELSRYLFVVLTFVGTITVTKKNKNFKMEFLIEAAPLKVKKALITISGILILALIFIVILGSCKMALVTAGSKTPAMELPADLRYWIISATMIVTFIYTAISIVNELVALRGESNNNCIDSVRKR